MSQQKLTKAPAFKICPLGNELRGQTLISLAPQKQMENRTWENDTAGTKRKSSSRVKTGTWETLAASTKNFFISSSLNTTFIADPL